MKKWFRWGLWLQYQNIIIYNGKGCNVLGVQFAGVKVRTFQFKALENSQHFMTPPLVSPWNDIWEMSPEIPYWWHVTTQIWVLLPSDWLKLSANQKHSFLRCYFMGKPLQNVGCFLRLPPNQSLPLLHMQLQIKCTIYSINYVGTLLYFQSFISSSICVWRKWCIQPSQ